MVGERIDETLELVPFFDRNCVFRGENSPPKPKEDEAPFKSIFVDFGPDGEKTQRQKSVFQINLVR